MKNIDKNIENTIKKLNIKNELKELSNFLDIDKIISTKLNK